MNKFQQLYKPILMPTIKEMIQQKRAKILILVTLLFLVVYITKADVPYITYFSSKNISYCTANYASRSSAIAWIYPENYGAVKSASNFYPDLKSSYNTNFQTVPSEEWALQNWYLSNWSSIDVILDTRWEAIETVTSTDEFKHSSEATFHIQAFPMSFSVLGSNSVEILLAEGWNPKEFPAYYIVLGGRDGKRVLFKAIQKFDKSVKFEDLIETFKTDIDILSPESWKSFHLRYEDGSLELQSVIDNKLISIIKVKVSMKLKPIYFLTRSAGTRAKWKIENRRFLYTNVTGETALGPTLQTPSEEICVSLYLSLCRFCTVDFYTYENDTVVYLKKGIAPDYDSKEHQWKEVRLLKADNLEDSVQIYVNTSYNYLHDGDETGFWAIDEIRVCTEDEIKISKVQSDQFDLSVDAVTCQSLQHPRWRPRKEKLPKRPTGDSLKIAKVTPTSIGFKRTTTYLSNVYSYNYKAVGAKQCSTRYKDSIRKKSNGYVLMPGIDVIFNNLVPYTYYDVKVSDAVYNSSETYKVLTSETAIPTESEIPRNVLIKTDNTSMSITWDVVNCTEKRGKLLYQVNIFDGNDLAKTFLQDGTKYNILGLKSFTNYTVEIITSRSKENLAERENLTVKQVYSVNTSPGLASKVIQLEAYSADEKNIQLRYELPPMANGIPVFVKYLVCLFDYKCEVVIKDLEKCDLWEHKYCTHLGDLLPYKDYHVQVSLRNANTTNYGDPVKVKVVTKLQAPAPPVNLTYTMVNCTGSENTCHINITWGHPYLQKSTIAFFDILLTKQFSEEDYESIKELYWVNEYAPIYSKTIRYIPFSTTYNVSVRSSNRKFSSSFVSLTVKTDDLAAHIDQSPKITNVSQSSVTFDIPVLDHRLNSYFLIAIVQTDNRKLNASQELYNYADGQLCRNFGEGWIANAAEVSDDGNYTMTIGDSTEINSSILNATFYNKPLKPDVNYCITFVITNRHMDKEHMVIYHENNIVTESGVHLDYVKTSNASTPVIAVITIIVFVAAITAAWFGLRFWRKKNAWRNRNNDDPIYMSLESLPHAVSNNTYDKLIPD